MILVGFGIITSFGTRSMIPFKSLDSLNADLDIPVEVVAALESKHLIRREHASTRSWYELTHDSWINPIQKSNEDWKCSLKNPLTVAAKEWERLGKDEGGLLRGRHLNEAREWVEGHDSDLDELERAFLKASEAEEKHRQELSSLMEEVVPFRSIQLADKSQLLLKEQPRCSLLLALEALNITEKAEVRPVPVAEEALRQALINLTSQLPCESKKYILKDHEQVISKVAISEDSQRLATGSADGKIFLWNLSDPSAPLKTYGIKGAICSMSFSHDGHWLAVGSADEETCLWDLNSSDENPVATLQGTIVAFTYNEKSLKLATGSNDGFVRIWDLANIQPSLFTTLPKNHSGKIKAIAISKDSQWLVTGSDDKTALLWELGKPDKDPLLLQAHNDSVLCVSFNSNSVWIATGSEDKTARLWKRENPHNENFLREGHSKGIHALAISPNDHWLVTGSDDGTARLWDLTNLENPPFVLRGHKESILTVAFSDDKHWLATGSKDKSIRLWDLNDLVTPPIVLGSHEGSVNTIAISHDNRWLVSGSDDKTVQIWDLKGSSVTPIVLEPKSLYKN